MFLGLNVIWSSLQVPDSPIALKYDVRTSHTSINLHRYLRISIACITSGLPALSTFTTAPPPYSPRWSVLILYLNEFSVHHNISVPELFLFIARWTALLQVVFLRSAYNVLSAFYLYTLKKKPKKRSKANILDSHLPSTPNRKRR